MMIYKYNMILKECMRKSAIFFDFFDTIVQRKVNPDTVKQIVANELSRKLAFKLSALEIYKIRIESEKNIATINPYFSYKELSKEICSRIIEHCGEQERSLITPEVIEAIETQVELENIIPKDNNVELLKKIYHYGKKIVIVSDFYMGKTFVCSILKNLGLSKYIFKVFISCDCKASKADKKLYTYVLNDLKLDPQECLMIGDNLNVDVLKCRSKGVKSYYIRAKQPNRIDEKCIRKEIRNFYKTEIENYYDIFTISLYYYTYKLYLYVAKNNIKNVIFLSREGKYLKRLFDGFLNKIGEHGINTHYLHVSRKATYLLRLSDIKQEKFDLLFESNRKYSAIEFLKNLTFSSDEIEDVKESIGCSTKEFNDEINDFENSDIYSKIINNEYFLCLYNKKRKISSDAFDALLKENVPNYEKEGLTLVDVGWKGTIQDNIFYHYHKKVKVTGLYLGLERKTIDYPNNIKIGLLFQNVPPKTKWDTLWNADQLEYEDILQAREPSVLSYSMNKGIAIINFDVTEDKKSIEIISGVQERIYKKIDTLIEIFNNTCFNPTDFEYELLRIFIQGRHKIDINDIKTSYYLNSNHYNNFIFNKTVNQERNRYSKNDIAEKISKYLKNLGNIFDIKISMHILRIIYSKRLYILIPVHKGITYCRAIKTLKNDN